MLPTGQKIMIMKMKTIKSYKEYIKEDMYIQDDEILEPQAQIDGETKSLLKRASFLIGGEVSDLNTAIKELKSMGGPDANKLIQEIEDSEAYAQ